MSCQCDLDFLGERNLFSEMALETAGTVTLEEMSTVTEAKQEKVGRQQGGQAED